VPAAPTTLNEGVQHFAFGATSWQEVERYDNCAAHKAICRAVQRVEAVDFVGRLRGANVSPALLLLEVKDYRKSKMRTHSEIAKELAAKVVGTLAGIVSAARANQAGFAWPSTAQVVGDSSKRLLVVLHVESPTWTSKSDAQVELAVLVSTLERELTRIFHRPP
jgi:hypothetical protein